MDDRDRTIRALASYVRHTPDLAGVLVASDLSIEQVRHLVIELTALLDNDAVLRGILPPLDRFDRLPPAVREQVCEVVRRFVAEQLNAYSDVRPSQGRPN